MKIIEIPESLLKELILSHSKLAQAEYNRNLSYNNTHFSHVIEDKLIQYFNENNPSFLNKIITEGKNDA
jgi:hypothetical protein